MTARRPRGTLLVALALTVAVAAGLKLPGVWAATEPLSVAVARAGGTWRTVPLSGRAPNQVVLSRNTKWCQCPGLAVAMQVATPSVDSAFETASALLGALRGEAERGPGRCFTVSIQVGLGRHWPWQSPALYHFSWYYTTRGLWQHFGFAVPPADIKRAQELTRAWVA